VEVVDRYDASCLGIERRKKTLVRIEERTSIIERTPHGMERRGEYHHTPEEKNWDEPQDSVF
jgi:hypothetical protein